MLRQESAHRTSHWPQRWKAQWQWKPVRGSHMWAKWSPNKQQEGLANTFILKVNINLMSLVTGKLILLSWDFSLPCSFSSKKEKKNSKKAHNILVLSPLTSTREKPKSHSRDFPGGPVAKPSKLPMQGSWVRFLARELDLTCSNWDLPQPIKLN